MQPLVSTAYLFGTIICMTVLRSGSHHVKRCRRHASLPEDPPPPLLAAPHRTHTDTSLANDAIERVSVVWGSDNRRGLSSRTRNSNCGHSRAPKFKSHPSPPNISDPKIPQSSYTHIHNGLKTRHPCPPPIRPPIGGCSSPEEDFCLCSEC